MGQMVFPYKQQVFASPVYTQFVNRAKQISPQIQVAKTEAFLSFQSKFKA